MRSVSGYAARDKLRGVIATAVGLTRPAASGRLRQPNGAGAGLENQDRQGEGERESAHRLSRVSSAWDRARLRDRQQPRIGVVLLARLRASAGSELHVQLFQLLELGTGV